MQKKKILSITITNLDEKHRNQLKGAIKFFSGDKNNIQIQIINGEEKKKICRRNIFDNCNIKKNYKTSLGKRI